MAKSKAEISKSAVDTWKRKDRSNENWFKSIVEGAWESGYKNGYDNAMTVAREKRVGKWKIASVDYDEPYQCPFCFELSNVQTNYCPHCGNPLYTTNAVERMNIE